jgi:plasmid stabilization system protein ParE
LLTAANRDVVRLTDFLAERNPKAALRANDALAEAAQSLSEMPQRGRLVAENLRELVVRFGRGVYIIQYRVEVDRVVVARIFHSLEDRPR